MLNLENLYAEGEEEEVKEYSEGLLIKSRKQPVGVSRAVWAASEFMCEYLEQTAKEV